MSPPELVITRVPGGNWWHAEISIEDGRQWSANAADPAGALADLVVTLASAVQIITSENVVTQTVDLEKQP